MRKALIEYQCPNCEGHFGALPECAGEQTTCSYCKTGFMIPLGLESRLVHVSEPEDDIEVRPAGREGRKLVPVKMSLPKGLGSFEAPVTVGTADRMATTFLGAVIMAIGVVIAAMLGLKKKS